MSTEIHADHHSKELQREFFLMYLKYGLINFLLRVFESHGGITSK